MSTIDIALFKEALLQRLTMCSRFSRWRSGYRITEQGKTYCVSQSSTRTLACKPCFGTEPTT